MNKTSKILIVCNHCGLAVKWYNSMINEVGYIKIGNKVYCEDCIKLIGHRSIDMR